MIYLIDACNLMFMDDELGRMIDNEEFEKARMTLISRLTVFASNSRATVVALFDGALPGLPFGRTQRHGNVDVCYSLPEQTADSLLLSRLNSYDPKECVVVTSDNKLALSCRAKGARVLRCEDFPPPIDRGEPEPNTEPDLPFYKEYGISDDEADQWMKIFKIDDKNKK